MVSNDKSDYVKACLGLILYGTYLETVAVKAIVYAGFQQGCKSKYVLGGFGKIIFQKKPNPYR